MYCADAIIDFIDGLIFKATLDISPLKISIFGNFGEKIFDQREPIESRAVPSIAIPIVVQFHSNFD
jgi:hypothetical protein